MKQSISPNGREIRPDAHHDGKHDASADTALRAAGIIDDIFWDDPVASDNLYRLSKYASMDASRAAVSQGKYNEASEAVYDSIQKTIDDSRDNWWSKEISADASARDESERNIGMSIELSAEEYWDSVFASDWNFEDSVEVANSLSASVFRHEFGSSADAQSAHDASLAASAERYWDSVEASDDVVWTSVYASDGVFWDSAYASWAASALQSQLDHDISETAWVNSVNDSRWNHEKEEEYTESDYHFWSEVDWPINESHQHYADSVAASERRIDDSIYDANSASAWAFWSDNDKPDPTLSARNAASTSARLAASAELESKWDSELAWANSLANSVAASTGWAHSADIASANALSARLVESENNYISDKDASHQAYVSDKNKLDASQKAHDDSVQNALSAYIHSTDAVLSALMSDVNRPPAVVSAENSARVDESAKVASDGKYWSAKEASDDTYWSAKEASDDKYWSDKEASDGKYLSAKEASNEKWQKDSAFRYIQTSLVNSVDHAISDRDWKSAYNSAVASHGNTLDESDRLVWSALAASERAFDSKAAASKRTDASKAASAAASRAESIGASIGDASYAASIAASADAAVSKAVSAIVHCEKRDCGCGYGTDDGHGGCMCVCTTQRCNAEGTYDPNTGQIVPVQRGPNCEGPGTTGGGGGGKPPRKPVLDTAAVPSYPDMDNPLGPWADNWGDVLA